MIVQANQGSRGRKPNSSSNKVEIIPIKQLHERIEEKIFKPLCTLEKRYLILVDPINEYTKAYVYDKYEQRLIYKSVNKKTIEDNFSEIYKSYKKSETKVVEREILLGIITEIEAPKETFTFSSNRKLALEIIREKPQIESIHIKRVKETFKYIDKYKVKLQVKIKYNKEENKATIFLHDEEGGVDMGTHRLEYDYSNSIYEYFYMEKLIISTNELELIFK